MTHDGSKLLLVWTIPKGRVQRFAASDAVVIVVAAAVRACYQMLNACFSLRDWLLAEKAAISLEKQETVELLHLRVPNAQVQPRPGGAKRRQDVGWNLLLDPADLELKRCRTLVVHEHEALSFCGSPHVVALGARRRHRLFFV